MPNYGGGGMNLATRYLTQVDERFTRESQAMLALNNDYKFTGDKTVVIYSIPVVPMNDYTRAGSNRYGTPVDLSRNTQTMIVNKDRSFTFIIDKGDKLQSEMVTDAGRALSRQLSEVWVPEYDTYVFKTLADKAKAIGNYASSALDKTNAYAAFLAGMEKLGDHNVPDKGRVAFCSYKYANLLKQDAAFMRYGDQSQEMLIKGIIGEVDGCKIVKVPSSRLPSGAAFILTHAIAATGPKQLEEYKIHDNPPGVSGWLVEGRFIYDCFVLNEKSCAIYFHGGQTTLKVLPVMTAATASGKSTIIVPVVQEGAKWYYALAATLSGFDAHNSVSAGTAITANLAYWTELTSNYEEVTASTNKFVRVVCVDASDYPLSVGDAELNVG